jgi:uncharacterized protein YjbI with pentapeptide repeats
MSSANLFKAKLEGAIFNGAQLDYVTIDYENLQHLPEPELQKYQETFIVI